MTEFIFTGPNGKTFNVTGPEGATLEDAQAKFEEVKKANPDWFPAPKPETPKKKAEDLTFSDYVKALPSYAAALPGRLAKGAAEMFMTGPKLMGDVMEGRVDPMSKEAIGRSLETAMTFSPAAPSVGAIRTAVKAVAPKLPEAPTREALKEASDQGYKAIDQLGIELRPEVVQGLATKIRENLTGVSATTGEHISTGTRIRQSRAPETFAAIERLKEPQGKTFVFADIDSVRQELGDIIRDKPGTTDALAATKAREHIDEYLSNIPEVSELAGKTRGNYAALKRSDLLIGKEERGELEAAASGSGANTANRIRAQAKNILLKPSDRAKFSPEEQKLLEEIARGSTTANIARLVSKLGPSHPLSGWLTAITTGHGIGTLGIGAIAQWLSDRLTTGKFKRLEEMTRARSPLAGPPIQQPPRMSTYPRVKPAILPEGMAATDALSQSQDPLAAQ